MLIKEVRVWSQKRKIKKSIKELTELLFEKHWPNYYNVGLTKQQLYDDIATHICNVLNENETEDHIWMFERC